MPPQPKQQQPSPPSYAQLGKDQLVELRDKYKALLAKPSLSPTIRMASQEELRLINAALKAINIAQSQRDLDASLKRRISGAQQHTESTHRSLAQANTVLETAVAAESIADATVSRPGYPKGIQTLGGMILMRAQQLRSQIRRIRTDIAPHTTAFIAQLDTFIAAQDALVKRERAAVANFATEARAAVGLGPAPVPGEPAGDSPASWKTTWQGDT